MAVLWGMPEHARLLGKSAKSWESLVPGCRAPALGPSAQKGAGALGCVGTEEVGGAPDPSFVQGPSLCGGSAALRIRGACCFHTAGCCL